MYQVKVEIEFEDGTKEEKMFDLWDYAAAWVQHFADEGETMPWFVTIKMVRK